MSDKAKKLQAMLEALGFTHVRVWWEPGSWMFDSCESSWCLGLTFEQAEYNIRHYMKAVTP